jgi:hypothetical protein
MYIGEDRSHMIALISNKILKKLFMGENVVAEEKIKKKHLIETNGTGCN